MDERPRYDGLGIAMVGLAAMMLVGAVLTGFINAPKPADDTSVQQSMAWASWVMVVVTLGAGVIGAFSLYLIYRTLQAAQRSALAAEASVVETRVIGRAQGRAYLSLESASFRRNTYFSVTFDLATLNAGQSPARNLEVAIDAKFVAGADSADVKVVVMRIVNVALFPDIAAQRSVAMPIVILTGAGGSSVFISTVMNRTVDCQLECRLRYVDVFGDRQTDLALAEGVVQRNQDTGHIECHLSQVAKFSIELPADVQYMGPTHGSPSTLP